MIDTIAKKLGNTTYDAVDNDYYVDCNDPTLGNIEFTFGKFKVVMEPGDYLEGHGVSKMCINLPTQLLFLSFLFLLSFFLVSMLSKYASPE